MELFRACHSMGAISPMHSTLCTGTKSDRVHHFRHNSSAWKLNCKLATMSHVRFYVLCMPEIPIIIYSIFITLLLGRRHEESKTLCGLCTLYEASIVCGACLHRIDCSAQLGNGERGKKPLCHIDTHSHARRNKCATFKFYIMQIVLAVDKIRISCYFVALISDGPPLMCTHTHARDNISSINTQLVGPAPFTL